MAGKQAIGKPYSTGKGTKKNALAFKPYFSTKPPPGTYDPNLDAQQRAANRGLADLTSDQALQSQRGTDNYNLAKGESNRSWQRNYADLNQNLGYHNQDTAQTLQRGAQDYGRNVEELGRRYQFLANTQNQQARQQGVQRGGALTQALAKRTANQAFDRAPIDTNYQRFQSDQQQADQRYQTGYQQNVGRLNEDTSVQQGKLGVDYGRDAQDRTIAAAKAARENTFFGQDIAESRFYQAAGTGYTPPSRNKTEATSPSGTVYRTMTAKSGQNKGQLRYVLPSGKLLKKKPA